MNAFIKTLIIMYYNSLEQIYLTIEYFKRMPYNLKIVFKYTIV